MSVEGEDVQLRAHDDPLFFPSESSESPKQQHQSNQTPLGRSSDATAKPPITPIAHLLLCTVVCTSSHIVQMQTPATLAPKRRR